MSLFLETRGGGADALKMSGVDWDAAKRLGELLPVHHRRCAEGDAAAACSNYKRTSQCVPFPFHKNTSLYFSDYSGTHYESVAGVVNILSREWIHAGQPIPAWAVAASESDVLGEGPSFARQVFILLLLTLDALQLIVDGRHQPDFLCCAECSSTWTDYVQFLFYATKNKGSKLCVGPNMEFLWSAGNSTRLSKRVAYLQRHAKIVREREATHGHQEDFAVVARKLLHSRPVVSMVYEERIRAITSSKYLYTREYSARKEAIELAFLRDVNPRGAARLQEIRLMLHTDASASFPLDPHQFDLLPMTTTDSFPVDPSSVGKLSAAQTHKLKEEEIWLTKGAVFPAIFDVDDTVDALINVWTAYKNADQVFRECEEASRELQAIEASVSAYRARILLDCAQMQLEEMHKLFASSM